MRSSIWSGIVAAALAFSACTSLGVPANSVSVEERSITQLSEDLAAGRTTSEALVKAYLDRIEKLDRSGPTLRSIISINPQALEQARALDAERKAGRIRGPLHGIPVLIKDNIETKELPTTAGSLALKDNMTGRDAPMSANLRKAGAILLGKTNLSEWANFRSTRSISGWSAVGGLVKNPYALDRNACGSSAGTGAGIAASLAAAGIGTETSGSIVCPSNVNGLVGFKPTVGLVSRTHVVPISHTQDTPGPMARSVMDAALVLTAIAGSDGDDLATAEADHRKLNYADLLNANALKGKRLGVLKIGLGGTIETDELFEQAQKDLAAAGATLVDVKLPEGLAGGGGPGAVSITQVEFKADVAKYLQQAAPAVKSKTLSDLIAFNTANADKELPLFGQQLFEQSDKQPGLNDAAYLAQLAKGKQNAGPDGIDKMLKADNLNAIVFITAAPAWPSDPAGASRGAAVNSATGIAAAAGYPHLTVPMGLARGLPVGLSFIGTAWSDGDLLAMGYAYEQASNRRKPPTYLKSLNDAPETAKAYAPAQ
jgi:amidase